MMGFASFTFGLTVFWTIPFWLFNSFPLIVDFISLEAAKFIVNELMVILSLILGLLSFLALGLNRFRSQKIHNFLMILFGALMGVVFGVFFENTISLFFVLIALAVYDIYAVFWGPIKKMFSPMEEENRNNNRSNVENLNLSKKLPEEENLTEIDPIVEYQELQTSKKIVYPQKNSAIKDKYVEYQPMPISLPVYHTPEISIGLGDFVFFSVLMSKAFYEGLINNNVWLFLFPFLGILIGSFLTFRMLEKYEILPALPIPILVGTLGFILALVFEYSPNLL